MKIEIKEMYRCGHCNKLYQIKNACKKHEVICSDNPINNRLCLGCEHLTKKETEISYDTHHGEQLRKVDLLYCGKIDSFLYPPKVEHKKNWHETEPTPNVPMKTKCEFHKDQFEIDDSLPFLNLVK